MTAFLSRPALRRALPLGMVLALLAPLAAKAETAGTKDWPLVDATPLAPDDYYRINGAARGLAGETALSNPAAATWQSASDWIAYSEWWDGRWRYLQSVRLTPMRSWAATELAPLRAQARTVYYPFSGPDFLYVNTFFPDSKYLIMGGLEPVGSMPDLAALQAQGKLSPYLAQIKTSLFTILAASFFKTKDMKVDFHSGNVDGLLPVIATFIARQGYTIDSLRFVSLGHDGTLHPHEAKDATGVQITYFKGDRSDARVALYFQADLGNDGLKDNPGFVRLMQRLGPGVTYLKAASYLLYDDYFSTIREGILANSIGVVEDDSGLPLRAFKPSVWTVTPYGNYTGPINLFKEKLQPDLTQFYANRPHAPLPFGSGYKFNASESSLLVATRVPTTAPAAAPIPTAVPAAK